jgi:hypothetical protein
MGGVRNAPGAAAAAATSVSASNMSGAFLQQGDNRRRLQSMRSGYEELYCTRGLLQRSRVDATRRCFSDDEGIATAQSTTAAHYHTQCKPHDTTRYDTESWDTAGKTHIHAAQTLTPLPHIQTRRQTDRQTHRHT